MINAKSAKEISVDSRLEDKGINLTDIDSHIGFLITEAANEGEVKVTIDNEEMKKCEGLYTASRDSLIRNAIRERYENLGYVVRFNRDDRMKLTDLTLSWG
ncbi:gp117 [Bacillus phage W.Ph.]|uniref:Gp117 n=1 Tax=Bacillus phage W.Ph. TaxID=764595 RepID=G9B1L8_9CAUD|nr:gp117 [Bacillus phage W.Ph.]ADH03263.1 gp117 [Bacillus phage W.Ph.]